MGLIAGLIEAEGWAAAVGREPAAVAADSSVVREGRAVVDGRVV